MAIYKYNGPIHRHNIYGDKGASLESGHTVKIIGTTKHENVYQVRKFPGTSIHQVHASHLEPYDGPKIAVRETEKRRPSYPTRKLQRIKNKGLKEHMLGFREFLLEVSNQLLGRYIKKASPQAKLDLRKNRNLKDPLVIRAMKRRMGINKASAKIGWDRVKSVLKTV